MRLFKFVLCLSILFFAFVFTAQAEEAAELEKMVVTATMTEREIENAPGSIEVITSQEIEEMWQTRWKWQQILSLRVKQEEQKPRAYEARAANIPWC